MSNHAPTRLGVRQIESRNLDLAAFRGSTSGRFARGRLGSVKDGAPRVGPVLRRPPPERIGAGLGAAVGRDRADGGGKIAMATVRRPA